MGAEAQHYQPQRGGAAGHINRRAQGGNLFSIPPSWWQPGGRLPERLETNPTRKRGEQRRPNAPPTGRMHMTWHRRGQAPRKSGISRVFGAHRASEKTRRVSAVSRKILSATKRPKRPVSARQPLSSTHHHPQTIPPHMRCV